MEIFEVIYADGTTGFQVRIPNEDGFTIMTKEHYDTLASESQAPAAPTA